MFLCHGPIVPPLRLTLVAEPPEIKCKEIRDKEADTHHALVDCFRPPNRGPCLMIGE